MSIATARGVGLLVLAAIIFVAGWNVNGWRLGQQHALYRAAQAEALSGAHELVQAIDQDNRRLQAAAAQAYAEARAQHDQETRTITREVIRYVQSSPTDCPLDAEWVRLYNASLGLPSGEGAAGGAASAASALGAAGNDQLH